jgi:hypothetical protein
MAATGRNQDSCFKRILSLIHFICSEIKKGRPKFGGSLQQIESFEPGACEFPTKIDWEHKFQSTVK